MTPMRLLLADGTVISAADTPIAVQLDDRLDAVERAWVGDQPVELGSEAFPVKVELAACQQRWLLRRADTADKSWSRMFASVTTMPAALARDWVHSISPEHEAFVRRLDGLPPRGAER